MDNELPCLPLIEERFWNAIKDKKEYKNIRYSEFKFKMFPQILESTALGFGGVGGSAITSAYTTVVSDKHTGWYGVFFGEKLAYIIFKPNYEFFIDITRESMVECSKKEKYIRSQIKCPKVSFDENGDVICFPKCINLIKYQYCENKTCKQN